MKRNLSKSLILGLAPLNKLDNPRLKQGDNLCHT